jgi:DNA helicase-2/ATP-dependent DNA helicase PcrA
MSRLLEDENMNQPDAQTAPNYVTCPCQHCSGNIEFDANQLDGAEKVAVPCPHCGLETKIFVPEKKVLAANPDSLDLNPSQLAASTFNGGHALVLAGAGCGKTKTIIARCEHLIANGVPASRIYVMTFTRKAAAEITSRVSAKFGLAAKELKASTFHAFCMAFIHQYPHAFGCQGYTIIDRDDQIDLMKAIRGYSKSDGLPTAGEITDIYSLARNTRCNLLEAIANYNNEYLPCKEKIAPILRRYEERKRQRKYLDYDDILDVVATQMRDNPQIRGVIACRFSHILVDEFQDTNNLQWSLLDSLKDHARLFCVGDDAQSIYGFRGADFKTIHSFTTRVQGATVLKLEDNYRSTQEILDLSNWLLEQSPLSYGKKLNAVRGTGKKPRLINFVNEWDEASWIGEDLLARRREGANWSHHMILTRANWSARAVEMHLIERKIPYIFIGGTKLMQSAHIRDVLSVLRIVANNEDELAWVRYLRLWPGIGEVTANRIVEKILDKPNLPDILNILANDSKAGGACRNTIDLVAAQATSPVEAFRASARALEPLLAKSYAADWDRRRRDFVLVEKLADKHTTILGFIEEYILDPVHDSLVLASNEDVVTLITVHSAKGTEAKTCYVINVSPGSSPSEKSMCDKDDIEEERRVLYVALTRAKDELIVSRRSYATHAVNPSVTEEEQDAATAYFFNNLPADLVDEEIIAPQGWQINPKSGQVPATGTMPKVGIIFDSEE